MFNQKTHRVPATLILFGLSLITLIILEKSVFADIENINFPDFNYKWIYSLIFGCIVGLSIIQNKEISSQGIMLIGIAIILGFCIDISVSEVRKLSGVSDY